MCSSCVDGERRWLCGDCCEGFGAEYAYMRAANGSLHPPSIPVMEACANPPWHTGEACDVLEEMPGAECTYKWKGSCPICFNLCFQRDVRRSVPKLASYKVLTASIVSHELIQLTILMVNDDGQVRRRIHPTPFHPTAPHPNPTQPSPVHAISSPHTHGMPSVRLGFLDEKPPVHV